MKHEPFCLHIGRGDRGQNGVIVPATTADEEFFGREQSTSLVSTYLVFTNFVR